MEIKEITDSGNSTKFKPVTKTIEITFETKAELDNFKDDWIHEFDVLSVDTHYILNQIGNIFK